MRKKLFWFTLEERNEEQEYSYDYLVKAKSLEKAKLLADQHAKTWYDDPDVETDTFDEETTYYFFGGSLAATVVSIQETTKEEWVKMMFERYSIN